MPVEWLDLLAQTPASAVYINPWKLLAMTFGFTIWALFAQWVDKDTVAVNTYRVLWNLVFVSVGAVALAVMLLVPEFAIGFPVYMGVTLILYIVYVVHRNGLVKEEDKAFTPAHIARVMKEGIRGKKKKEVEVKERVRLTGPGKKVIAIPEDEVAREQYRVTQDLLFDALWRRAALVEITPAGQTAKVVYTVDSVPTPREPLPRPDADGVVQFLKQAAGLNLEERRKPQSSKMMAAVGDTKTELHVKTDGSTAGEKLLLRFVGSEKSYKTTDLGFTEKQLELVQASIVQAPKGLVLVTAPPGQGLTTTTYSFARSHDAFLQNIQMLEFARDLEVDNITQHLFTPGADKTFFQEFQKVVRTDPDVLVLPEIRDRETAALACEAAGHKQKVYVALPALDVLDALRRWMKLVGDNAVASKSLIAVVNQRLVRKLCTECKQPYKPDATQLRKMNMPADKVLYRAPEPQYDKHGNPIVCQTCHGSSYYGLTAAFDILPVDNAFRAVLGKAKSFAEIQSHAQKLGIGIQQQALQKVFDGVTSIQEVVRATKPPSPPAPSPGAAGPGAPPGGTPPKSKPTGPTAQPAR
ncbi:MAG: GspE/PulE family protein [Phycisphaerae bacterium]